MRPTSVDPEGFRRSLAERSHEGRGYRYHVWAIRGTAEQKVEGMASFFTFAAGGFGAVEASPWPSLAASLEYDTEKWNTAIAYAAPFGLLPCPTLLVVIGTTLLIPNLHSKVWSCALVATGLLYGAVGVLRLDVVLDWSLLLASAAPWL